jgi:hypothetical protein
MAKQSRLIIMPPRKGYAEVFAHNDQPRFTSSGMLNVMILEPIQERFRIAQRMGVGKYDLYDFHTGGPYSFSTITIPADGGNVTVNLPPRGCFTMTDTTHDTVTIPADCQTGSFTFPSGPNDTGGTIGGNVTFTGSGSPTPITIPTTQPPRNPSDPTPDPAKPWLQLKTCVGNELVDKWVYQNILSVHNALPAYMHEGTCYQVSGKRSETGGALNINPYDATKVFETCLGCLAGKKCFYRWSKKYNCATATWLATEQDLTYPKCLFNTQPIVDEWYTDGTKESDLITYYYLTRTGFCTEVGDCSSTFPEDPEDPDITPPSELPDQIVFTLTDTAVIQNPGYGTLQVTDLSGSLDGIYTLNNPVIGVNHVPLNQTVTISGTFPGGTLRPMYIQVTVQSVTQCVVCLSVKIGCDVDPPSDPPSDQIFFATFSDTNPSTSWCFDAPNGDDERPWQSDGWVTGNVGVSLVYDGGAP